MKNSEKNILKEKIADFLDKKNYTMSTLGNIESKKEKIVKLNIASQEKSHLFQLKLIENFLYFIKYDFETTHKKDKYQTDAEEKFIELIDFLASEKETEGMCSKLIYDKVTGSKLLNKKNQLIEPLNIIKNKSNIVLNYLIKGSILINNILNLNTLFEEVTFNNEEKEAIVDYYVAPVVFNTLTFNVKMNLYDTIGKFLENKEKYTIIFADILEEFILEKIKKNKTLDKNKGSLELLKKLKSISDTSFFNIIENSSLKHNIKNIDILFRELDLTNKEKEIILSRYLEPKNFQELHFNTKMKLYNIINEYLDNKEEYNKIFDNLSQDIEIKEINQLSFTSHIEEAFHISLKIKNLSTYNTNLTIEEANDLLEKINYSDEIKAKMNINKVIISSENNHDYLLKTFNLVFLGHNLDYELIKKFNNQYFKEAVNLKIYNKKNLPNTQLVDQYFMEEIFNEVFSEHLENKINQQVIKEENNKTKIKKKI